MEVSKLNDQQKLAVFHPIGQPAAVIAGAGSGKTKVLTTRVGHLIDDEGVIPKRTALITFTNKAAGEIRERLGYGDDHDGPRICTIHSLALSAIRRAPKGFGLNDKVTPLDEYDQKEMVKRLIDLNNLDDVVNPYLFLEKIGFHRARGIGFAVDFTADVAAQAQVAHAGYHNLTAEELDIWKAYEKEKTCHPPGTLIDVVLTPASTNRWTGFTPAVVETRPIELVKTGDSVVSWRRKDGRCLYQGRRVIQVSRKYNGWLLNLQTKESEVEVTPNHQMWVKFNKKADKKHIVYLMTDGERFRIGTTRLTFSGSTKRIGLTGRLYQEKGNKAWILGLFDTAIDAYIVEQIYSYKYGIPQTIFNKKELGKIWKEVDSRSGALQLLHSLGMLESEPLMTNMQRGWGFFRFFKTAACNIIPKYMSIPQKTRAVWNKGVQNTWRIPEGIDITAMTSRRYEGSVYSLDVEEEHTYIANDMVVANCNSVVDFDDMIHLVVRRGQTDTKWLASIHRMFDHVLQDETQDTNVIQWAFINMLLPPDNLNMFCVGDPNQCQPPGTKVKVVLSPPCGNRAAVCEERSIESLKDGDKVVAWSKHDQISYAAGRSIRVASRPYSGTMIKIKTEERSTECTPNHWNWVKFNKNTNGKYMVYLMYRKDRGYRVGLSVFKRGKAGQYGLSTRMNQERAEKAWILRVCDTRHEAEAWEEIYSLRYGIPESMFESSRCLHKTQDLIELIFSYANPEGGSKCLLDHGLLEDHPIIDKNVKWSWRGYFKTVAANLIPEIMDIPIAGRNLSTKITEISKRGYEGLVYSLDVEKDHTYLANGLVVGNSIYGFNGAAPEILVEYAKEWRGTQPKLYKLEENYRSVPEVVKLANKTQLYMTDTIPLRMESHRGKLGHRGRILLRRAGTPRELAAAMSEEIVNRDRIDYKDIAILIRAGSQVRDIEVELVRNRIPYIIRGTMGLLQTEEVKDILCYLKIASNPQDFSAFCRSASIPRRGVGEAALKKIRDFSDDYEGDLIETLKGLKNQKLAMYVQLVEQLRLMTHTPNDAIDFLLHKIGYAAYLRKKYKKYPERIEIKETNIQRLRDMIASLMADRDLTIEDVVFQLTMQDQKDQQDGGKVVVSTIHAAKGLEWNTVYLWNVIEGSLPHKWCTSEKEVEEERRVAYVGFTRARDTLIICVPSAIEYPGRGVQFVAPSRFLTELEIC